MTETPGGDEARRIVDDLEDSIVDVGRAQRDAGVEEDEPVGRADDEADEVPGSPEPSA